VSVVGQLIGVVFHVRGLQTFKFQPGAEKMIDRGTYAVLAQPSASWGRGSW
jgi:hypothetical protein